MKTPVCIIGPTACYKTETAVCLADRLNGEVISADSVQIYKELNIGSAKPSAEECRGIPYHLINLISPDDRSFSVHVYQSMASECLSDIQSRGLLPIICGGSGLYVNSIIAPLNFAVPKDPDIRMKLEKEYDRSPENLFSFLRQIDPESASRLHPNDRKRIVRAVEVYECSGKRLSDFGNQFQCGIDHPVSKFCLIGLTMARERLYQRINLRVDRMIRDGLVEEVRVIFDNYKDPSLPALQAIGYRQLLPYLRGESDLESAVEQIKLESRRFAKRQLIWFRRNPLIRWYSLDQGLNPVLNDMIDYIEDEIDA